MHTVSLQTALRIIYWNLVAAVMVVSLAGVSFLRRIHRFDTLIVETSRAHQVDSRLVSALIWKESRFKPHIVGSKGEIGLMQVTETAGREWARSQGVPDFSRDALFHPATNLRAGTWYLARAIRRWSQTADPLPFALAEYNAGRSNAQRWAAACGGDGRRFVEAVTYPTTRKYIEDILKRYRGRV